MIFFIYQEDGKSSPDSKTHQAVNLEKDLLLFYIERFLRRIYKGTHLYSLKNSILQLEQRIYSISNKDFRSYHLQKRTGKDGIEH